MVSVVLIAAMTSVICLFMACGDSNGYSEAARLGDKTAETVEAEAGQSAAGPRVANEKTVTEDVADKEIPATPAADFDYIYNELADGIEIVAYSGNDDTVRIPESIDGDPVVIIGTNAFHNREGITSIIIPDTVILIGETAFAYCYDLTNIIFGNGLTAIGSAAFAFCTGLTDVTMPDSVASLGYYAFANCTGLQSIKISDGLTNVDYDSAFFNCVALEAAIFKGITYSVKEDADGRVDLPQAFYDAVVRGIRGV
jgi:hypothetical protein